MKATDITAKYIFVAIAALLIVAMMAQSTVAQTTTKSDNAKN